MSSKTRRRGKRPQSRRSTTAAPKPPVAPPRPAPKPLPISPIVRLPEGMRFDPITMPGAFYKVEKPPFKIRFWRALGFYEKRAPIPDADDLDPDWRIIATIGVLDWKDRLRVLISGRIMAHQIMRSEHPMGRVAYNAVVSVLPPGYLPGNMQRSGVRETATREQIKAAAEVALKRPVSQPKPPIGDIPE